MVTSVTVRRDACTTWRLRFFFCDAGAGLASGLISDLLLLPSETESFGLVALEAMAAGVPVVSSNVGGLPEVNVQEETGFLRDVGDVEGMAQDVLEILADGALRGFKQRAKARASEFTIDRILPHYLNLYHRALDSSAS